MLKKKGVPHKVLNAKYHAEEAEIVSRAGQPGSVTIATNMAGRGTDIMLGEGVPDTGGLHIIGTERHESRRIDNQLRGRAGRQGDPGSSQFYLSLEDELMRRFGAENIMGMMDRLGFEEDQPIESKLISRAVESAQKRVEGSNFDVRKVVLQYDDVMNQQREIIYKQRREVLESENVREIVLGMIMPVIERTVEAHCSDEDVPEDWDLKAVVDYANGTFLHEGDLDTDELWGKEKSGDGGVHPGACQTQVRGAGAGIRRAVYARIREGCSAARRRQQMDGPYRRDGSASLRYSPSRIRRYGSAARVPVRRLRDVPADDREHPGGSRHLYYEAQVQLNLERQAVAEARLSIRRRDLQRR